MNIEYTTLLGGPMDTFSMETSEVVRDFGMFHVVKDVDVQRGVIYLAIYEIIEGSGCFLYMGDTTAPIH